MTFYNSCVIFIESANSADILTLIMEIKLYKLGNKKYKTVRELAEVAEVGYETLKSRLRRGWSIKEAVKTPATR